MHVPWGWIKQRPHFLAEELSNYFDINLFCEKGSDKNNITKKAEIKNLKINNYIESPLKQNRFVTTLFYLIKKKYLHFQVKKANIIWLTFPAQYNLIEKSIKPEHIIIYDCMDDMLEIYKNNKTNKILMKLEEKLCKNTNILIASSDYLKQKLIRRYKISSEINVINNAIKNITEINKNIDIPKSLKKIFLTRNSKNLVYIGTISNWFDFDLIIKILEKNTEISFILIGPVDTNIPKHDRIFHYKPVEHKYVFKIMQYADALIMPFKLNELVKSVNPVKAYEYIYSGKPVILKRYPETEKFNKYCYLYDKLSDLLILINDITKNKLKPKQDKNTCIDFVKRNTWNNRIEKINTLIKQL